MTRAGCLGACLLLTLTGCPSKDEGSKWAGGPKGPRAAAAVGVQPAVAEPVRETLVAHAALEPEAHVDVSARSGGQVVEVLVEADDQVQAGQPLLRLDRTRADLALEQAKLAVDQAETSLARQQDLGEKGLATKEELEQARESLAQAKLTLRGAQLDLEDTELKSPLTGVVTERLVNAGDTLQAGAAAFKVADRDPLIARARVPEAQAERVRLGQPALVRVDGIAQPLKGEVIRLAPLVDLESGTVIATIAVRDAAAVRIHRFATIEIVVEERADAVTIPQDALALRGDENRVLVCEPQGGGKGVVRQRDIVIGVRNGPRVEILSGLQAGELVVVAAPDDIRDGTQVRIVDRDAPPAKEEPSPKPTSRPGRPEAGPGKAER